jgi:perosamine synthetase
MTRLKSEAIINAVTSVIGQHPRVGLHEPELNGREIEYLTRCIETGWVSYLGEFVDRFERELATVTGTKHAIVTVNGTVAAHTALVVSGIGRDDEVLVPSLTFVASANSISHAGAIPHFVDSEEATLGIDPVKLEQYLENITAIDDGACRNKQTGRRVRAIMPVHIFGHPSRMREICRIADRFHLKVIEDAAEALGSLQGGRPVGGDGVMGTLSFNGNKIVTTGGGGAIITNDDDLAQRAKHITTTAKKPHPYELQHDEIGYNYRLPNINAAVGCAQLERLQNFVNRKRQLAEHYAAAFVDVSGVQFFKEPPGAKSNYWLNAILLDEVHSGQRNELIESFMARGIQCRPVWRPMHMLPMYKSAPRMDLSGCESIARRLINIPSSPALAGH